MTRLLIFDVDGTLVDSADAIVEAQRRTFATLGLSAPTRARALAVVGLSLPEAFTALVGADGPIPALVAGYKAAWLTLRGEPGFAEPLFPGVAAMLAGLAAETDLLLGLATGKSRRGVERLLHIHRLHGLFATAQTADEHPSKPHPSMLLRALAETGVAAHDAVYVGDTTYDMAAAVAARVPAIGVGWGHHCADALVEAGARAVAADVDGLRRLLGRWIAGDALPAPSALADQSARAAPRKPVAST